MRDGELSASKAILQDRPLTREETDLMHEVLTAERWVAVLFQRVKAIRTDVPATVGATESADFYDATRALAGAMASFKEGFATLEDLIESPKLTVAGPLAGTMQGRRPERCYPNCINFNGRCIYCGWTRDQEIRMASDVPTIYDIHNDESRPATQADLDELQVVKNAYGKLRIAMTNIQAVLLEEVKEIRAKGPPSDPEIMAPLEQAADPDPDA